MRRRTARALLPLAVGAALAGTMLPAAGAKRPVPRTAGPTYTNDIAPAALGGDDGESWGGWPLFTTPPKLAR